jgi:hypothetical protein
MAGYLIVAAVAVGVAALLWAAGSLHYQSCVNAAEARTYRSAGGIVLGGEPRPDPQIDVGARREAVQGCSRLPW